jgi:hypothetical protein
MYSATLTLTPEHPNISLMALSPSYAHRGKSMTRNPVGWFEIYVQDVERAKASYESVFGGNLQKIESPGLEMWAFPMLENGAGAAGALVKMPGCTSGGNSTLVYFMCDDCAIEAGRAKDNGGKIFKEKFEIGKYGFIALVHNSKGNMIGLHSTK